MATAKLVLIYPRPHDEAAFERLFRDVHLPMIEQKLTGLNRLVATRVISSPQGQIRTYRIAEVHFSDLRTLQACIESDSCKEVMEHAKSISTGGPPIVLVCEEESRLIW